MEDSSVQELPRTLTQGKGVCALCGYYKEEN